ncbi:hypothetical protein [Hymenobacter cavernae]|uniref:Type I-E CRISPR-associated protein Cse1/CasA n=1 Tax=Hymenobacter cavernae TaxID=2044852 RepID=A0ABQ1UMW0_9BACT|nr:hypothetical protein [Hymenobacter cavernae]GGF22887.1 hypothetical protein GCM10011383_38210 [Hymenobacter cavernae]
MYTSYIGQRLLALYNQRTGSSLTARQFFEQQLYPLFFEPAKYLQWIPSSPFAQVVAARDLVLGGPTATQIQLANLHRKIETVAPDGSFVIGFPAAGVEGTTSGQVSNVGPVMSSEEMYCSWIGGALGVGVSGGLSLLLDEDDVLWTLYEGWAWYRKFLDQRPSLKGNQIDTWNGTWLVYVFSEDFDPKYPDNGLNEFRLTDTAGVSSLPTQEWVQVLFALAGRFRRDLTAYVYGFGKSNRTVGFIPLKLEGISHVCDLEDKLFLFSDTLKSEGRSNLLRLYTTQHSFSYACQQGSIGVAAIKPEKIQDYIGENQKNDKSLLTPDGETSIHFAFYQIWIIAMLDRPGILDAADRLAQTLIQFTENNDRAKKGNSEAVKTLWKAKSRKSFVEALIAILEKQRHSVEQMEEAVNHANTLPFDQLPYFVTLTHFRYLALSIKNNEIVPLAD